LTINIFASTQEGTGERTLLKNSLANAEKPRYYYTFMNNWSNKAEAGIVGLKFKGKNVA